jgi:acylphosphatase/predicted small secreted protein
MGIVGFVRNLPDETVEVVCEGEAKKIDQFVKQIDRKGDPLSPMDIDVFSIVETPPINVGSYNKFDVEYNGKRTVEEKERDNQDRMERMILGASILHQEMRGVGKDVREVGQKVDGLGQKMDCVGEAVKGVGQKMNGVGKDVRDMHGGMNKRFDHMAQRYDLIALSLAKAIDRMDKSAKMTDKAIEQSRKEAAASNHELAKAVNFMIKKMSAKAPAPKKVKAKNRRTKR